MKHSGFPLLTLLWCQKFIQLFSLFSQHLILSILLLNLSHDTTKEAYRRTPPCLRLFLTLGVNRLCTNFWLLENWYTNVAHQEAHHSLQVSLTISEAISHSLKPSLPSYIFHCRSHTISRSPKLFLISYLSIVIISIYLGIRLACVTPHILTKLFCVLGCTRFYAQQLTLA